MANHITWSSIELLHNVVRTLNYLAALAPAEGGQPLPTVTYKGKVKLHGTNTAVQVTRDGVFYQSRTQMLEPGDDYKGFAQWASQFRSYWTSLPEMVVFGEWCGPGVEPGMAISAVGEKQFAVFGLQIGTGAEARIVYEPAEIEKLLAGTRPKNMHVLPWQNICVVIDFANQTSLETAAALINDIVVHVEKEDPWVKATFSVSGLGEGIVFYPVGENIPTDPEGLAKLMFKAKGEKHRTTRTKDAAQLAPEVVSGVEGFVALVVTEARLQQAVTTACGGVVDVKLTGKFLGWVTTDVEKESQAELAAAGLTWGQVKGAVQTAAREWFKAQTSR